MQDARSATSMPKCPAFPSRTGGFVCLSPCSGSNAALLAARQQGLRTAAAPAFVIDPAGKRRPCECDHLAVLVALRLMSGRAVRNRPGVLGLEAPVPISVSGSETVAGGRGAFSRRPATSLTSPSSPPPTPSPDSPPPPAPAPPRSGTAPQRATAPRPPHAAPAARSPQVQPPASPTPSARLRSAEYFCPSSPRLHPFATRGRTLVRPEFSPWFAEDPPPVAGRPPSSAGSRLRAVRRVRQAPTAVDETTRTPAGSAVLPLPPLARSLHTPRG